MAEWNKCAPPLERYAVIATEVMVPMAERLQEMSPTRFTFYKTRWGKFPDGTDNIQMGGFEGGKNRLRGRNVLFLASFHNNDVSLSQFYVMVAMLESFINSMTVLLAFYPTGTMERILNEGEVATASTMARLFSTLPNCGKTTRLMVYDLHTLQNRFYVSNNAAVSMHTAFPLLIEEIRKNGQINCVAFPDEGASKRFGHLFNTAFPDMPLVICGKHRDGDKRLVHIQEGDPKGLNVVIVDDLVQSGGTLSECSSALRALGANEVSAFVVHAVFPQGCWSKFARGGELAGSFKQFFLTNSNPAVTQQLPTDDVFQVLDLLPQILRDLDWE